jgi:methylmalonyl-CoA mutase
VKTTKQLNLSKDFSPPKWEEWKQLVRDGLKGADYDKAMKTRTYEGITLEPIYRREDIRDLGFADTMPAQAPYVRGNDPQKLITEGWYVAQAQTQKDLKALNEILHRELMRGLSMVNLKLRHDDFPDGISITSVKDLETALKGIDLVAAPLFVQMDVDDKDIFPMLDEYISAAGGSVRDLKGCLGFDPSSEFARKGYLPLPLDELWGKVADAVIHRANRAPQLRCFIIDGTVYEAAGASSTQELAMVLDTAIGYIQGMMAAGMDINTVAPLFAVKLALGSNFFVEIAKIRAFRLLWAEMIKAFGGNENSQKVWIHGKTATFNKSTYDLYVNMLRTTTESFSGVIGGVDSLQTDTFDAIATAETPFAKRIARNQQLILAEEAHFAKVADPAGGCYYIESLTAQLAEIAWSMMQELEQDGGMIKSLKAGKIHERIAHTAKARIDAVHKRRDVFVGVNMYANPEDKAVPKLKAPQLKPDQAPVQLKQGALPRLRAVSALEELRTQIAQKAPRILLINIGTVAEYKARADFASGYLQIGGFAVDAQQSFVSAEQAIAAAQSSDADAFCLCSTDARYEQLVEPLCNALKPALMILAGYPQDMVERYRKQGIDIFIHLRSNAYDTLKALSEKLEVWQ